MEARLGSGVGMPLLSIGVTGRSFHRNRLILNTQANEIPQTESDGTDKTGEVWLYTSLII